MNQKGEVVMEITGKDVQSVFTSILAWIVIPALIVYGYQYGNEASQYIAIFYMWIVFILQLVIGGFLVVMLALSDDIDLNNDTLKDKKKIDAILKWNEKLKSKFQSFKMTVSTILYLGLAVLIASTGAIWTALIFTLAFVVFKYIFLEIVKQLYEKIVPQVIEAAVKLQTEELLDKVDKLADDGKTEARG